ncbi:MAG: RdgB/HAM1 family non-canonical purine NTP pyrophosphatase [Nitrospirota bacterium]|nr:MAG: RdgB/HAM1 family non-canonical purine NTP pyrophosphatase [Nitrospirota bacterium]
MKFILATSNLGKIEEINSLFSGTDIVFEGLDLYPDLPEVIEDGDTFRENAYKKAKTVYDHTGVPVIAEDSGLEVDALGGAPGVRSARFAHDKATDRENIERLIQELEGVPPEKRSARFVSVFCMCSDKEERYFEGYVKGHILGSPRGTSGFGYDPLFVPDGYDRSFAELGPDIKNKVSHRSMAIDKMLSYFGRSDSGR